MISGYADGEESSRRWAILSGMACRFESDMMASDTIYALSSGQGIAGIAVIRVSGSSASVVLSELTGGIPAPRRAVLRLIRDPRNGEILDRAMVLWLPGPRSSTGEDMAEFQVHGSRAVVAALLAVLGGFDGVRPAEAGEFTRRAFGNGRMDLVEVEGLADLLDARTARQRRLAVHHLLGEASSVFESWRAGLIAALAHVEAAVDFADEEGVAAAALAGLKREVTVLSSEMAAALGMAERAAEIRSGIRVALVGMPNTGKSSILNVLTRREAAIVSSRPGTTRDVIEVLIELDGMAVSVSDTAGLRDGAEDEIELIGMSKTRDQIRDADVIVWVAAHDVPGSMSTGMSVQPTLWLLNKADSLQADSGLYRNELATEGWLFVSARTGDGMAEFVEALVSIVRQRYDQADNALIVRERQKQAIYESIRYLNDSVMHAESQLELVAEDLRKAAHALGRVTGRIDVEELLSVIFSEFCIGK